MTPYSDKLASRIAATGSRLCVGLDPRFDLIDGDPADFLRRVIEETASFAAAFKPNSAYFEQRGADGFRLLETTLSHIPAEIPVILDAKRSDIGETQKAYAQAAFGHFRADAVTLNASLGFDTIEPFLDFPGHAIYLLAVTSNPGAREFALQRLGDGHYVFEHIQRMRARAAGRPTEVGFVVGLTNASPELMSRIVDAPLLIPGLGAQGGELSGLAGSTRHAPSVINVSRGILYADPHLAFGTKARQWAETITNAWG
ncbi:MAG: orotidine-5'-phosphate decarboxylase [Verrucomicrobiales bacterium]